MQRIAPAVVLTRIREDGVVVIGAGVAGLAAARRLRTEGVPVTLIEALARPGGRAATVTVGNDPFDLGATWLHDAARNPLAALASPADTMIDSASVRSERTSIDGRPISAREQHALDAAWDQLDTIGQAATASCDTSLAHALAVMGGDPWLPLLALWEGAIIAAADADCLSVHDWHRNRLGGRNLIPADGVGVFASRVLATPVTLSTPATSIGWGGKGVTVGTPRGAIQAAAAIVTVSTGVLAGGGIRFDPALTPAVQAAIHALPMGLLSKVALPSASRLGIAPGTVLVDRGGNMTFNAWPLGRPYLAGFVGGRQAWALAADPAACAAFAREELARTLGGAAVAPVGPAAIVTDWGTNPAFLGSYAYARPGDADQRGVLAAAFPAERLIFAGEATRMDGLAGTVGGAFLSGVDAANRLMDLL